jgi:hypothetical protein
VLGLVLRGSAKTDNARERRKDAGKSLIFYAIAIE